MNTRAPQSVLTVCGASLVAIGSVLPWIRPNPALVGQRDGIPSILLPQMNPGVGIYGLVLFGVAGLAVATLAFDPSDRKRTAGVSLAGIVAVVLPVQYVVSTSLVGFDGTFVPSVGWYLTLAGGLGLLVGRLSSR